MIAFILIFSSIFKTIAKKIDYALFILFFISVGYLGLFTLNWSTNTYQEDQDIFISAFFMLNCASTAIFISLIIYSWEIVFGFPIILGVFQYVICEIMLTYIYRIHSPQLWIYLLMTGLLLCIVSYFLMDMKMMITRRSQNYQEDSWFAGFINLHTDILFVFWKDLFLSLFDKLSMSGNLDLKDDNIKPLQITVEVNTKANKNWEYN